MSLWHIKAPVYSRIRRLPPLHIILRHESRQLTALLQQITLPIHRHLDVGSGTGDALALLPPAGLRVCLDASPAMLARLRAAPKLAARAEHLPFRGQSFDFITAIGVSEYVADVAAFFRESRRVLTPEGFFLFTTAPPKPGNYARQILGEPLHFLRSAEVAAHLTRSGWRLLAQRRSWLQEQWLVQPFA
ncbi:MAG: class I SAM-dependent methyltransferase [candidate division KSB1 bacterium]|nr:class I SAM-dependent methyltransferase [candidate division KSB1 bacterium]MDZ7275906.1 class I SAM-dependent methyltransferase [candidate division KSB1 bacterium]MDZ7287656.1 class I SAM-dependent methyltransferase [candidate division KSB1 bacterium]MDZ7309638.1 class I SAM-dependent methyltransferase [candidate division KSB1 bacterium]MDZ7350634.1 class I SAM-dependent methyltransferase [candidate division KSB1 bacterium]